MEGGDVAIFDAEFGLRDRGYQALAVVAIGYSSDADVNAGLAKSRLPIDETVTEV